MSRRGKIFSIFSGIILVLTLLAIGLLRLSRQYPEAVTAWYTRRIFPVVTAPFRFLVGLIPFSLAELLLIALILGTTVGLGTGIVRWVRGRTPRPLLRGLLRVGVLLLSGILCFIVLGGFNYSGLTFAETAGYTLTEASASELEALCRELSKKASALRAQLPQDAQGVTCSPLSLFEILERAQDGYDILAEDYPELGGSYGTPKPALLSRGMSYLQISGIYPYLIPEAIVNCDTPVMSLPHTVCHEMAHQRGVAREDEANFVAYLAAIRNPEPLFQYSGYLEAFIYSMNALYSADSARWRSVASTTNRGILRDMAYINDFWESFTTPGDVVEQVSTTVNDLYLKGNDVEDGVQSYGRVVDLLIAERRRSGGV